MAAETVGHLFGVGPLGATLGSPYTIGGFEAHGLAVLIGILLFRAGALANRQLWHAVGFTTHLFLGLANLLFWTSFAEQGLVMTGYVTTALHIALVILQAVCLRSERVSA